MKRCTIYGMILTLLVTTMVMAAPRSSSSSRSSFSSSKPSSSRSSFGSSSSSSKPSSPSRSSFGSSSSSSKPKSSTPSKSFFGSSSSSSKPSAVPSSKPSGSKPLFGSGSTSSGSSTSSKKPLFGSSGSKPSTTSSVPSNSQKPISSGISDKGREAHKAASQRNYAATQKATAPPRPTYTRSDGKTVPVDASSPVASKIRSQPSTYHTPESRNRRTEVHIHQYGYSRPLNWYYSQPPVYLGGGYSPFLWYMMAEWSADRRAAWLYHNQGKLERDAYERGIRDAEVAQRVAEMEAKNVTRNVNYVDPEFAEDPSLMYDQQYVEAVYNPPMERQSSGSFFLFYFFIFFVVGALVVFGYFLVFKIRWGR